MQENLQRVTVDNKFHVPPTLLVARLFIFIVFHACHCAVFIFLRSAVSGHRYGQQSAAGGAAPAWPRKGHFLALRCWSVIALKVYLGARHKGSNGRRRDGSLIRLVPVAADSRRKMQLATAFDHFSYHSPANKIICNIARVGNEQQNASQRILIPAKRNYNLPWHSQTKTFLSSTPSKKRHGCTILITLPASAAKRERKRKIAFCRFFFRLSSFGVYLPTPTTKGIAGLDEMIIIYIGLASLSRKNKRADLKITLSPLLILSTFLHFRVRILLQRREQLSKCTSV